MSDESKIATHSDPAWRERTNYIVKLDLTGHGLPGAFEQFWTRTDDRKIFELCCIPFFTYGHSLGDLLEVTLGSGEHTIHRKNGHRTIRFAFTDDKQAHERHAELHGRLIEQAECLVENRHGGHYGAIDIGTDSQADSVIKLLRPPSDAGVLIWEWADPPTD